MYSVKSNLSSSTDKSRVITRDSEVKEEAFLEYINQLVMTGEVSGLFPKDEMDALLNDLRPALKRECPGRQQPVSSVLMRTQSDLKHKNQRMTAF